jgi:hypothetical protein
MKLTFDPPIKPYMHYVQQSVFRLPIYCPACASTHVYSFSRVVGRGFVNVNTGKLADLPYQIEAEGDIEDARDEREFVCHTCDHEWEVR